MNEKIKNWIIKNETWKLKDYIIPSKIYSSRSLGSKEIETKGFRDKSIKMISKHEKKLIELIDCKHEKYIREFPIPIFDQGLWLSLCNDFKADEDEITGKSILWIDFFLPERNGVVLEADGIQHSKDIIQYKTDFIRDQYLKKRYNIETYRFSKYVESWEDGLEWVLLNTPQVDRYEFSGWEEDWVNYWKEENKSWFSIMRILENKYPKNSYIKLSTKQVYKLNLGSLFYINLDKFNSLFWELYKHKIEIIKPSKP